MKDLSNKIKLKNVNTIATSYPIDRPFGFFPEKCAEAAAELRKYKVSLNKLTEHICEKKKQKK